MMKKLNQSPRLSRMLMVVPVVGLLLVAIAAMRPVEAAEQTWEELSGDKPKKGNTPAEFPGGREALNAYVKSTLVLPEIAFEKRKSQTDFVRVTGTIEIEVQEDGTPAYRKAFDLDVEPKGEAVAKAVEKQFASLVSQMPKWSPSQKNGKAIATKETISVSSVSGNFLNYASYLESRQQKTLVSSKPAETKAKEARDKTSDPLEEVPVVGRPLPGQPTQAQKKSASAEEITVEGKPAKQQEPVDNRVFIAVEKMPEFPGGQAAMFKFLSENFVYPEDAKQAKISGMMVASFVVNAKGKVSDVQLMKKLHPSLDQAFEKVLQNMPTWAPGTQNGKAVAVKYTVPFRVVGEATASGTPEGNHNQEEKVYIAVEHMPEFPGGQAAMFKYLSENFVIPAEDKAKNTEGTIIASFVVTKEGKITKVQVVKSVTPGLDQETIRVLANMPTWKPGTQNGKTVAVKYTIPYRIVAKKNAD